MIRAFTVAALLSVTTLTPRPAEADQTTASGTAPVLQHTTVPLSPGTTADAMEPPRHDDNATLIALKTAVTLSTALAAERLWRDRPIAAISTVLAVNAIAAAAAVHNARVLRHQSGVVGGHTR
jgi:hypothetical protein